MILVFENGEGRETSLDGFPALHAGAPFPEQDVRPAQGGKSFPERLGRSGVVKDDVQVPAQLEMLEGVIENGEIEPVRLGPRGRRDSGVSR